MCFIFIHIWKPQRPKTKANYSVLCKNPWFIWPCRYISDSPHFIVQIQTYITLYCRKLQQFLFLKYMVIVHAIWTRRISILNPHWLLKSYPRKFTIYSGSYFTKGKHKTKRSLFETLSENSMVGVERRKSVFIQWAHKGDRTLNVNSREILVSPNVSCFVSLWSIRLSMGCSSFSRHGTRMFRFLRNK